MILNFFDAIKEFIMELLSKWDWGNVLILFAGIAIGFVMCAFIYVIAILVSLKNQKKPQVVETEETVTDEAIQKLIRSALNEYQETDAGKTAAQKFTDVRDISWQLIHDIARLYYPKSHYPIYELSIDELMRLNHYITNRIEQLFSGKILRQVKKIKISQILKILDMKKKIDESKAVKAAKKTKLSSILSTSLAVLNVLNPVYWVKKLMINATVSIGTNKLAKTIIEIVGEETVKVYNKSVFQEEKEIESDIEKTIKEIEENLESNN